MGFIQRVRLIATLKKIVANPTIHNPEGTWYHLTDNEKFKLDPKFTPDDASISIRDRSGQCGIYLAPDIETWVNGHGYWRPFVVEFHVDQLPKGHGLQGRWGNEMFVPASLFDKLTIQRVIPLDAYAREKFGQYGWIEDESRQEFDTGKPITLKEWEKVGQFKGYKYKGKDVRDMPSADVLKLKQQLKKVKG